MGRPRRSAPRRRLACARYRTVSQRDCLGDDKAIEKPCRTARTRDRPNDLLYERRADAEAIELVLETLDRDGHEPSDRTRDMGYSTYEMGSNQAEKTRNALLDIMSPCIA